MQRYFIDREQWRDNHITIVGNDVHHITRVMRMGTGDEIIAIHPDKGPALCEITDISDDTVVCKFGEWRKEDRELPVQVTIVSAIGKGDKLEQVVQKGTELGAHAFIPFKAERCVAKWENKKVDKKINRLEKIAKEAAEQSERSHVPDIYPPVSLSELRTRKKAFDRCFFAYADEARRGSSYALHTRLAEASPGEKVLVVFGPEGGFSDQEVQTLDGDGFLSIRLGPRILRMETAPLYFLSSISFLFEEQE
ncbi:16S rRNA (uracil(1498)-N(3))-methyltransferase [Halobacillus sp. KGW1]|uniref:16S rRNA (uracil(1498)-N(3))-methyltransferase n=1 Tax=Halobacillus sp. KGW1 TaxID=1793726 RepID=UPI000783DCEA|nr:16S rRNA (uracil(1498)-N(3))-methyltransferase [Halobacillus sp. KGW1]